MIDSRGHHVAVSRLTIVGTNSPQPPPSPVLWHALAWSGPTIYQTAVEHESAPSPPLVSPSSCGVIQQHRLFRAIHPIRETSGRTYIWSTNTRGKSDTVSLNSGKNEPVSIRDLQTKACAQRSSILALARPSKQGTANAKQGTMGKVGDAKGLPKNKNWTHNPK